MKKLLALTTCGGAYGYHLVNKTTKENVIIDVDVNTLNGKRYYNPLFVISKLTDVVVFTNGNKYFHGDELDILYGQVDTLNKEKVCEKTFIMENCLALNTIKNFNNYGMINPFYVGNKTYFVGMQDVNMNYNFALVKLCCIAIYNSMLNDVENVCSKFG